MAIIYVIFCFVLHTPLYIDRNDYMVSCDKFLRSDLYSAISSCSPLLLSAFLYMIFAVCICHCQTSTDFDLHLMVNKGIIIQNWGLELNDKQQ